MVAQIGNFVETAVEFAGKLDDRLTRPLDSLMSIDEHGIGNDVTVSDGSLRNPTGTWMQLEGIPGGSTLTQSDGVVKNNMVNIETVKGATQYAFYQNITDSMTSIFNGLSEARKNVMQKVATLLRQ